jgi:hypothetical protein
LVLFYVSCSWFEAGLYWWFVMIRVTSANVITKEFSCVMSMMLSTFK